MASVRIRRRSSRAAPLAYVPVEPNRVVVVPTDDIPQPDQPNSPENEEYLRKEAEKISSPIASSPSLTSPSSSSPLRTTFSRPTPFGTATSATRPTTSRLRSSTVVEPRSPPFITDLPTRGAASVFQRSNDSIDNDGQPGGGRWEANRDSMPRSPRDCRGSRSSWFVDHVRGSVSKAAAGAAAALKPEGDRPELARSMSPDQFSAASSVPNVDVVIPPDVREGLGAALANRQGTRREPGISDEEMHHNDIVEHLDVIDAQISTVSYLSNAANSIIIPPLSWYSRKPVVSLPAPTRLRERDAESMESENELDAHVEEVLSKRAWLRRSLQGLWAYLKTPIGFVAAIYGFLVVFWGAAIVFFLGKLINLHDPYLQGFWVEISSQVVNGLFTVQGVGFLPWRIMDTWNTFWIYHYARKDRTLRMRANLPPVGDFNDIPDPLIDSDHVQMLTDKQLQWLRRHQVRLLKSQTWYRPHATDTHRAFSLKFAIAICISVDLNSVFQILLCGCMWGLNRFQRPAWTVATLIPLSFLCGIASGILIWKGGERSKKTAEVRERLRQALEQEKKVLRERYGSTIAEEPTLLRAPPSGDPEKDVNGRGSSESARKKSPLLKTLAIDETMTIPEDVEPTTTSSSKEKRPFKEEKDDSKIILVTPKSPSIKDFGDGKAE